MVEKAPGSPISALTGVPTTAPLSPSLWVGLCESESEFRSCSFS